MSSSSSKKNYSFISAAEKLDRESQTVFPFYPLLIEGNKVEPRIKPFLKWAGGKSQLLPELLRRVPKKFNNYFEPMIGSGALFFALRPPRATLMDTNEELINCYKVVKRKIPSLITHLSQQRYDEQHFYQVRNADRSEEFLEWSSVQRAARLIYLNKSCFNGLYRVNAAGQFNVPFGKYTNPRIYDEENLASCSRALRETEIICCSYEMVVKHAKRNDFVYFDPPYLPLNETSSFTSYSKNGFDVDDHIRLAEVCSKLDKKGVYVMLSNSYCKTVLDIFKGFKIETVLASRAINSKASHRGKIKEVIVRNY